MDEIPSPLSNGTPSPATTAKADQQKGNILSLQLQIVSSNDSFKSKLSEFKNKLASNLDVLQVEISFWNLLKCPNKEPKEIREGYKQLIKTFEDKIKSLEEEIACYADEDIAEAEKLIAYPKLYAERKRALEEKEKKEPWISKTVLRSEADKKVFLEALNKSLKEEVPLALSDDQPLHKNLLAESSMEAQQVYAEMFNAQSVYIKEKKELARMRPPNEEALELAYKVLTPHPRYQEICSEIALLKIRLDSLKNFTCN